MKYQAKQKARKQTTFRIPNFFRRFLKYSQNSKNGIIPSYAKNKKPKKD